jgi:hypothetical protein
MKSLPTLLQDCQAIFNEFIRKRDAAGANYFKCISCGQVKPIRYMEAGHFYSVGNNGGMRFDEENVHGQCFYCNESLHGNTAMYAINLLAKLGPEKYHALIERRSDYQKHGHKWSRSEVEDLIKIYKQKVRELDKQFR